MPYPRPYYTLAIRQEGRWSPQFGDYSRAVVAQEARDAYASGAPIHAHDRKIVKSAPDCDAIDEAVASLNRLDPLLPFSVSALLFPRKMESAR